MRRTATILPALLALTLAATSALAATATLEYGRFGTIHLYPPQGEPRELVLFLSGDGGWGEGVLEMAGHLAERGALVAGIDVPRWGKTLRDTSDKCIYTAGDLEELAHALEEHYRFRAYTRPLLVGYSSGATLAYTSLVQSPQGTFRGALSLGFGVELPWARPMCRGDGVGLDSDPVQPHGYRFRPATQLKEPWIALNGEQDQVSDYRVTRAFVAQVPGARFIALPKVGHGFSVEKNYLAQFLAAYDELSQPPPAPVAASAAASPGASGASVAGLPLVEVAARGASQPELAIMLSGDGGWAGLDRELADVLAAAGIPVVGWDSLRYFWKARTPEGAAQDLDRVIHHYLAAWHKDRVILVGYSFGANTLLPMLNRLPAATRAQVALLALLAPGQAAGFEFHFSDWVGSSGKGLPLAPEAQRLQGLPLLCLYGADEGDTLCPALHGPGIHTLRLPGGHHFDGAYAELGKAILGALPPASTSSRPAAPP